jgi:transcriptional regulator with XRE-family HTH domain
MPTSEHPLESWRRSHGWTQTQLAEAIGISQSSLSKILSGDRVGLSKAAALTAWEVCGGSVPLRALLLGPDAKPKPRRKRTAA